MSLTLQLLRPEDVTREDSERFWDQGVCMDDWNYIVLAPPEVVETPADPEAGSCGELVGDFAEELERLLTGCYDNRWHLAQYRGQTYAVGVAYHS